MGKATVMTNDTGKSGMSPTESQTTRMVGNFSHGSRETPETSVAALAADRSEKARCHKSDMHVTGNVVAESDSSIVPKKPANKCGVKAAGGVGGGKGTDQREHFAIATGPDTVPERERETVRNQVAWVVRCTAVAKCVLHVSICGKSRMR